jgi:PAS domain S-box-containing protein
LRAVLHTGHSGCCLTPQFRAVTDAAAAPLIVVDGQGFFIYANPAAQALLGYTLDEITQRHITEIVDAETPWVVAEFEHLVVHQTWSGSVLLRRLQGDLLKVAVNAFSSPLPEGGAEHVALLNETLTDGPAIERLPEVAAEAALSVFELSLLQLMSGGFGDAEIAAMLGLSEIEVKRESRSIRTKLRASSRTEAAITALRERLIA